MAFGWRAEDGPTLNAGLVFQGTQTSIAIKKPYIFVIFQGGGRSGPPVPPLDPCICLIETHPMSTHNMGLYEELKNTILIKGYEQEVKTILLQKIVI